MFNLFMYEKGIQYPTDDLYRPSEAYPEYPHLAEGLAEKNDVYNLIRDGLIHLKMDQENIGKETWNPLKDYVERANTVLIKPNFVMHKNMNPKINDLSCLVTHPSIIRCMLDYAIIALKGKGKIFVADAPMQSCQFNLLMEKGGYQKIIDFYKQRYADIIVEFVDLRLFVSEERKGILHGKDVKSYFKERKIDLGQKSNFEANNNFEKLTITNYDPKEILEYHHEGQHLYCVSEICLQADVIINLPKPKSHRKAGYTGALKNFVGISALKQCLPHHTKGSKQKGGDEHLHESLLKNIRTCFIEKRNIAEKQQQYHTAFIFRNLSRLMSLLSRFFKKDAFTEGSWYGNDTIWRTILDLNQIVQFCDKKGKLTDHLQRKILNIGDMIICGEKEGPLLPSPKHVGGILISDNPLAFDLCLTKLMGFNYKNIPILVNALKDKRLGHFNYDDVRLFSNKEEFNNKLKDVQNNFSFQSTAGWKGIIDKKDR